MFSRYRKAAAILLTLAALGGCGGGGGGAGNGGPLSATPVPVPAVPAVPAWTSGLVPDAPIAGAILYADAAPLRVLRDGAVWTYRGIDQPYANQNTVYTNVVRHSTAGAGVLENASNIANAGIDNSAVRFEGGAYKLTVGFRPSEKAAPLVLDLIELRSPVKVNDQYVSFDGRIADSGADFDGDKINEALDAAIYSRVIGEEVLDLPNRRQVKTVRVDMTFRARYIFSTTRTAAEIYESVQSVWYAPGIGVVKTRSVEPGVAVGAADSVTTEILENWDGVTEGLGHTDPAGAWVPAGSELGGMALEFPLDAAGFDNHAVVATQIPGQPSAIGVALTQFDARGKVVATRSYRLAELFPGAAYFAQPRLLRVGDELRLLATTGGRVSMLALDATGQRILRPAVTVFSDPQLGADYERKSYHVAADGAGIWLAWLRTAQEADGRYSQSLVVQHVDADAQPLGAARVVLAPVQADISDVSLALDGARLALSWHQGHGALRRLVTIDTASGAPLADKSLDIPVDTCIRVDTLALQPGIAMTCSGNAQVLRAARLDAGGELVLSSGATLATDMIKAPWLSRINGEAVFTGSAGKLFVSAHQYGKYWAEDPIDTGFTSVFQVGGGSGVLAADEPVLLARIAPAANVDHAIKLGNRLLLVGSSNFAALTTMVVWLPN